MRPRFVPAPRAISLPPTAAWSRSLLAMAAFAASVGNASAQQLSQSVAPIEVHIEPEIAAPGDTVLITGSTPVGGKQLDISITVMPPQGAPVHLAARASADGTFAMNFGATGSEGAYRVKAVAVDGKGVATDSFEVVSLTGMVDRHASALADLYQALTESRAALNTMVQATPPSPPRDDALTQLDELDQQLREAPERIADFRKAMEEIAKVPDKHPVVRPPFRAVFDTVNRAGKRMRELAPELREQVAATTKGADLCDDLALAQEGLGLMSTAFNVSNSFFKFVSDFVIGYGLKKVAQYLVGSTAPSAVKAAATLSLKTQFSVAEKLLKKKPVDSEFWALKSAKIATGLMQVVGGGVFDLYCEKFEGPVTALFHVDFLHDGAPYLKYDIELDGRMAVHYQKTKQPGAPVAVNGYIEGTGSDFRLWDNTTVLDDRGICRRMACFHNAHTPLGVPFVLGDPLNLLGRQAIPLVYFLVRVSGHIVAGKLTLEILDAKQDFSDLIRGQVYYFGFAGLIPEFFKVTVPFQKARFILAKGMRDTPVFPITVDQQAKVSRIGRTFTREERRGGDQGVVVQFTVVTKACNPKCP